MGGEVVASDAQARRARVALVVLVLVGAVAWGFTRGGEDEPRERFVTSASEGVQPWPFTVGSGVLRCRPGEVVTFESGGTEYGLNGTAMDQGYPSPKPIWAEDPMLGQGLRVGIGTVIAAGRALCE